MLEVAVPFLFGCVWISLQIRGVRNATGSVLERANSHLGNVYAQMNTSVEDQPFTFSTQPSPNRRSRQIPHRRLARIAPFLIVCCLLGTIIANVYSWQMTSTGLLVTQLIPLDSWLFPGTVLAYSITAVLQFVIILFYLLLPHSRLGFIGKRQGTLLKTLLVLPIVLSCILFSIVLSVFSITKRSQGQAISDNLRGQVVAAHDDITRLDRQIANLYNQQVASYDRLAERARQGQDESGIADEGPIYRTNKVKASRAISEFGALSNPAPARSTSGDVNELWRELKIRHADLQRKLTLVTLSQS